MFDRYIELREEGGRLSAMNDIDPDQIWYWLVAVVVAVGGVDCSTTTLLSVSAQSPTLTFSILNTEPGAAGRGCSAPTINTKSLTLWEDKTV